MDYRQYDNALGRFNCIDKLSEENYEQSPYMFANGNPMVFSDPSGLDGIVYGMAGESAPSNPYPRGHDSFGYTTLDHPDRLAQNIGSAWGDGGLLAVPISFIGNTFTIDWNGIPDNFKTSYNTSTGDITCSKWHESSVTRDGNGVDILHTVNPGYWEKSYSIVNGIVGNYLTALDKFANANANKLYKYGTRALSAAALTEANAARMLSISRRAQGIGGALAIGTGIYGLSKEGLSAYNTGTYNSQAVIDNSISIAGGVSGSLLLAAEVGLLILSPALVPVLTVVAVGATAYGVYTLGRDIYDANH